MKRMMSIDDDPRIKQEELITNKDYSGIIQFIRFFDGADLQKLSEVLVASENPMLCYNFALACDGRINVDDLQEVVLNGPIEGRMYHFAFEVPGADQIRCVLKLLSEPEHAVSITTGFFVIAL